MPKKQFKNCDCKCSRKCFQSVPAEEREMLFKSFYNLSDNVRQNVYIRGLVQTTSVKQRRPRDSTKNPRNKSLKYFLTTTETSVQVCKKFFIDTFQISDGRLYKCCSTSEVAAVIDGRGHKVPGNKVDVSNVKKHIESFPSYKSHYTRSDTPNRRYLHSDLSIRKMYLLYKEKCTEDNVEPVKEKMYYHVFSTQYNLHFKPPSKDTCQRCDSLQQKILYTTDPESRQQAEIEKEVHLRKAQLARDSLNTDKSLANENCYVLTFDLQKALPFPKLSCSTAYYKTNMYVYNFGIHVFNTGIGHMNMWDETKGSRGSQEIASCLVKHLKQNASGFSHIVMYSDSCTGQNRNIKLSLSLLKLVQDPNMQVDVIDHKFLESGHSYLPNDADFGIIESKARKKEHIYCPNDWIELVKTAKRQKPLFEVTVMERTDFLSTKSLENQICNKKTAEDGGKVNWLKIKWLRYCKNANHTIYYKETLQTDMEFSKINIEKRKSKGRPSKINLSVQQELMYPTQRSVKPIKKQHMNDLLQYIPPKYHPYYRQLHCEQHQTRGQTLREAANTGNNENEDSDDYVD